MTFPLLSSAVTNLGSLRASGEWTERRDVRARWPWLTPWDWWWAGVRQGQRAVAGEGHRQGQGVGLGDLDSVRALPSIS